MEKRCPKCSSENVYFSRKKNIWICEDCESQFDSNDNSVLNTLQSTLSYDEYWSRDLWIIAPVALASSYRQLYEYVKEQNVGCTLFLIRDVFELTIKIPVTIIFNGIHELNKGSKAFDSLLIENPKIAKLYEYSMQMLSTGKWWECVRLASYLEEDFFANETSDDKSVSLYRDTILYLRELHKKMYFRIPGKTKTSMVTWRNRTLGHSCLANNPNESYGEIPYILEMFKTVGDISVDYYKKVCLADNRLTPLRGIKIDKTEPEVYILYTNIEDSQIAYTEIHNFIAGKDNNLCCFDGFEKGKAYLLNYGNGERYRDLRLSEWLTNRHHTFEEAFARNSLSEKDVFADNLETNDINNLEERLLAQDDIAGICLLSEWIMESIESCNGGMLLFTAEQGLGKSTFCSSINPLECPAVKYSDEQHQERLEEFLDSTVVRVWHFNSEYRSRKDIFIPGIRDALLTLSLETDTQKVNKLCGRLETQYNNLVTCAKDLRSLYFAECLNNTIAEYRTRTARQRLLLILDGIDEVSNIEELCSFMPDPSKLNEGIYILMTCRTKQEIRDNPTLLKQIDGTDFKSSLEFTRKTVVINKATGEKIMTENVEYHEVVSKYVEATLQEQKVKPNTEIINHLAESFEYRFSSLAAYRRLCKLSPVFYDKTGTDLFGSFMHQIEINVPETYVRRLKWILNILVCVGQPITLRELAFLSGERYVSYRLLGMMNDIQAFIKITRSGRGNCYELSHAQWKEAVKVLVPYGDVYFRRQCNTLLLEMDDFFNNQNINNILKKSYEGELWLLKNTLKMYNNAWAELKENWFEEINLEQIGRLITIFLQNVDTINYFNVTKNFNLIELVSDYAQAYETYSKILDTFYAKPSSLLIDCALFYENAGTYNLGDKIKCDCLEKAGDSWYTAGLKEVDNDKRYMCLSQSIVTYVNLLHKYKDTENLEKTALWFYKVGRSYQTYQTSDKNKEAFSMFKKMLEILDSAPMISSYMKEYLCRAYIRCGQILRKIHIEESSDSSALHYFLKAEEIINTLLNDNTGIENYLDTKEWCESNISNYFEWRNDYCLAIIHRLQALSLCETLISIDNKLSHQENKLRNLKKLGELYQKDNQYFFALDYVEKSLSLELLIYKKHSKNTLKKALDLSTALCNAEKIKCYKELYNASQIDLNLRNAFQEVYLIYRKMPESLQEGIPENFIDVIKENRNPDHIPAFVVSDNPNDLDDERLLDETKAILGVIYRDFLTDKVERKNLRSRDQKELCIVHMEEVIRMTISYSPQKTGVFKIEDIKRFSDFSSACNEAWDILKDFPKDIVELIPLSTLMVIKENRNINYIFSGKVAKCSKTTRMLLGFLIHTYLSDIKMNIKKYKNGIQ